MIITISYEKDIFSFNMVLKYKVITGKTTDVEERPLPSLMPKTEIETWSGSFTPGLSRPYYCVRCQKLYHIMCSRMHDSL